MDLEFAQAQDDFRSVVRDFAENEVAPHAAIWDRDHTFPVETIKKLGKMGLFGLIFPATYGGSDAPFSTLCIAIEELARADSSVAITLSAGVGLGANPIFSFGDDEQKATYLPSLCTGEALGAFGLTESGAGSDAGASQTKATKVDGGYLISGSKAFITNSGTPITSVITVTARTEEGISAFIVESGSKGLTIDPPYRKMGWHASDTHGISLDEVFVPDHALLGTPGKGLAQFLSILDDGRIAISALAVGLAQGCLDESLAYAKSRVAFGKAIGTNQAVAFKLADMAVAIEAARTLTYKAAALKDAGLPFKKEAAIAKLFSSEAAVTIARDATQIFGGAGFIDETPVARHFRDSKILEIGEGTSEIQRLVISRELGLKLA